MNPISPPAMTLLPLRTRDVLLGGLVLGFVATIIGVTSFFRLSTETDILRESAMSGANGLWTKKIALNVGWLTTSLVRAGSHCFTLGPERQAAFDSIRGAEVGIYKLEEPGGWVGPGAILARADKAMSARRWDRVVGVSRENELVAVYFPQRGLSAERMKCCVLVLHGRELIVAGASGNLEPLLEIAEGHLALNDATRQWALR